MILYEERQQSSSQAQSKPGTPGSNSRSGRSYGNNEQVNDINSSTHGVVVPIETPVAMVMSVSLDAPVAMETPLSGETSIAMETPSSAETTILESAVEPSRKILNDKITADDVYGNEMVQLRTFEREEDKGCGIEIPPISTFITQNEEGKYQTFGDNQEHSSTSQFMLIKPQMCSSLGGKRLENWGEGDNLLKKVRA